MARFATIVGLITAATALLLPARSTAQVDVPGALVTTNTKQVYRFHFSGLQSADAIRLAQKIAPLIGKLPADNPLRKAVLHAKDAASFADDYRLLRNHFMEAGIDTIYFLAEDNWIQATTLPGYVVLPATDATLKRLQERLKAAGHTDWAEFLSGFHAANDAPGWMICAQGRPKQAGKNDSEKQALVKRAFNERNPIGSATVSPRIWPAYQVNLNNTTPLTVVNLEKNLVDGVLPDLLQALVPSAARTAQLLNKAEGTSVAIVMYPYPAIRHVAYLATPQAAQNLSNDINGLLAGLAQKLKDVDQDIGPLLALFARSTMLVGAKDNDVVMVMKPPLLFDLDLAQRTVREAQQQDWTALRAPKDYHWEIVGALGATRRIDVLAWTDRVRVRGSQATIAPAKAVGNSALFDVPLKDCTLRLLCDPRGILRIDKMDDKGKLPPTLPALELLDYGGRVAAVLRLDLGPGDPRFDLARTKGVLQDRLAERTDLAQEALKEYTGLGSEQQRLTLEAKKPRTIAMRREDETKLREKKDLLDIHRVACRLITELNQQIAALEPRFPGTTLVKDGDESAGSAVPLAAKYKQFRFAGQWLFYDGMLTIHQDAQGFVAGTYSAHADQNNGNLPYRLKNAILSGKVTGSTLKFALLDTQSSYSRPKSIPIPNGKSRLAGEITLDPDGLGGQWVGDTQDMKTVRGRADRLDIGSPEADWFQEVNHGDFAGYWIHKKSRDNNVLLKPLAPGIFEGSRDFVGNLRSFIGAAAGNHMFLVFSGATGSLRGEAVLSADGQKLTFNPVRADPKKGPFNAQQQELLELTRQNK